MTRVAAYELHWLAHRLRRGGDRLGDDAAKEIEVDDIVELAAKAGSSGCKEYRVVEGGAEQLDRAHRGGSNRGPRGPGTGAANGTAETPALRVLPPCTPSSRASDSSAVAYATLGWPWNARVYGDPG